MKLAVAILCALAAPAAADPPPHALVSLGASTGFEDNNTTHTLDFSLGGRITPTLWGITTGRAGSSNHACGDCVGDADLREGTLGILYLPCHGTVCVGASASLGYARRETYFPPSHDAMGNTYPAGFELHNYLITEARGRLVVHLIDHVGLEANVALRYERRLYDPQFPNVGGALATIALDAWL